MGRRARSEAPCVRVDRTSGCGRIIIQGKTYWLGRCPDGQPSAEQRARAARIWHEHLAGVPVTPAPRSAPDPALAPEPIGITVAALGVKYLDYCEAYYRTRTGKPTSSVDGARMALRALFPFADTLALAFTPQGLPIVRDATIREGRPRVTCNAVVRTIRRMFKWAACEGHVPPRILAPGEASFKGARSQPTRKITASVDGFRDDTVTAVGDE